MTHTPTAHLQALRDAVSTLEQIQQQPSPEEPFNALLDQIWENAKKFRSFRRVKEIWSAAPAGLDGRIVFMLEQLRAELGQREALEQRDIFDTALAAEYLDLSMQSVKQHYTYTGFLKGELLNKRQRIFRKAELDEFTNNPEKRRRGPKDLKPEKNRFKPKGK